MATVQRWTGAETEALRQAMRLSIRAFAAHLGVDAQTVNKWEARGNTVTLFPDTQALMDTALGRAPEPHSRLFSLPPVALRTRSGPPPCCRHPQHPVAGSQLAGRCPQSDP